MGWIKEHLIASLMAIVVIAVASWATPILVLIGLTPTLVVPTRLAMGARAWPEKGLDSIIEHLALIFILSLITMIVIGVAFAVALEVFGGSDQLILWFTGGMVLDCAICAVWVAKWTVEGERARDLSIAPPASTRAAKNPARSLQA
jgi:hypothetical protein